MLAQHRRRDRTSRRHRGAIIMAGRREHEFHIVGVDARGPVQVRRCLGHDAGVERCIDVHFLHLIDMEGEIPKAEGLKLCRLLAFGQAPSAQLRADKAIFIWSGGFDEWDQGPWTVCVDDGVADLNGEGEDPVRD